MFIRAHRERKLGLLIYEDDRWLPTYIRDLEVLPDSIQVELEQGYWTITRSNWRFSSIPIDHAHEKSQLKSKRSWRHDWSHRESWHAGTLYHDWFRNPYEEDSENLVTLDNTVCESAVDAVSPYGRVWLKLHTSDHTYQAKQLTVVPW